ncbi:MAG: hypothetical protein KatS3mg061_3578 [Dehalococcoidia bacterium]|nr:MAG: hypothetical protein KatS3mg061_3578 [Dehalococcoidia bacterium]
MGSGIGPDEYAGYGLDASERHRLFDAWASIVLGAWQHRGPEPYVYETPWWRGRVDGRIIPATVQQPHPLFARATLTPEFCRAWGRMAQPLLLSLTAGTGELLWNHYLDGLAESEASEEQKQRALEWSCFTQHTYLSDQPDPVSAVWEYSKYYLHKGVRANNGYDIAPPEEWERRKSNYRRNTLLAGTPQQVLEKLAPWAERGLGHVMIWGLLRGDAARPRRGDDPALWGRGDPAPGADPPAAAKQGTGPSRRANGPPFDHGPLSQQPKRRPRSIGEEQLTALSAPRPSTIASMRWRASRSTVTSWRSFAG